MSRFLAAILLAFVVFACGDPVNVEKRPVPLIPIGPQLPGLDVLGKDGLVSNEALQAFLKAVAEAIKNIRKTLEGLNVCPHTKGNYKDGGHYGSGYGSGSEPGDGSGQGSGYEPGYGSGHGSGYESGYAPGQGSGYGSGYGSGHGSGYAADYRSGYGSGYVPDYKPDPNQSYEPIVQYKRDKEASKVDMACEILKPIIEAIVKLLKQLEKLLGCMMNKEKGYKGDYKDCKDDYKNNYPHDSKSGY